MAQAPTAGAGPAKQFIDVLPLALAGEFHQPQFGDLGNLGARLVVAHGLGEMLQEHQLIPSRLHVDEVDNHHTADVAQLELTGNFCGGFTVGPEHRFAGIGRAGEGAGVHIHHGEGLRGFNDYVAARGQIHPGLKGITDGRMHLVMLKNFAGIVVVFDLEIGLIRPQERINPGNRFLGINHHPLHLRAVEVAQHPMDEVFVAVKQHRGLGGFRRLLDGLPLAQQ